MIFMFVGESETVINDDTDFGKFIIDVDKKKQWSENCPIGYMGC